MKAKPKHEVRKHYPNAFRTAFRVVPTKYGQRAPMMHQIAYRTVRSGEWESQLIELGRGESSSAAWKDALSKIEAERFAKVLTT